MRASIATSLALLVAAPAAPAVPCERVAVWRDGRAAGAVCRETAAAQGLVIVDLGDGWTPTIYAPAPDGSTPDYTSTYLALAQERLADAGLDGQLAAGDRYLELFGIEPTLGVVRARLADDARHACHQAIDPAPLVAPLPAIAEESAGAGRARIGRARELRAELDRARARAKLPDLPALAAARPADRAALARLTALDAYVAAVRAAQAHLACDGLFRAPAVDGAYTWATSDAVRTFQRGAMILPTGVLDADTRAALARDSRERDLDTALRVLRARVVAATGLVEDGTAGAGEGTVLGRALEAQATWRAAGYAPDPDAAPDLVSAATEAAARALGWHDVATTRAFLDALASPESSGAEVALPLPAPPAYHGPGMQLAIEIDRGGAGRRPALTIVGDDRGHRVALARWPTTTGGWQAQQLGDAIVRRWKGSPAGAFVWRDLYVAPRWLAPETTPDRELVRATDRGVVLAREQFGPSYRGAFGLVAFVHLAAPGGDGSDDLGIRTHATANLPSVARGTSHGCHRLLGLHAVRLAELLLATHGHVARGDTPASYARVVRAGGRAFPVELHSLGYRVELVPPIPLEVR